MMSGQPASAFYLRGDGEPVYALFDGPSSGPSSRSRGTPVGVLLCPLFGNDDLCSYRARREWALSLARAGRSVLRIDLPGTGNSAGGPSDPKRLEAWTDAATIGAAWLREQAASETVVAIGVGLGGLVAYRAASHGAVIDDLVLWSVPARGRTLVRQLRALSRLEASHTAAASVDQAIPSGAVASAGFLLSAETVEALEALDLAELSLPRAGRRRALLLERDGIEVDAHLRAGLERSDVEVTVAPGRGYGAMVAPPQKSRPPREVFSTVEGWLASAPSQRTATERPISPRRVTTSETLELTIGGVAVRETPILIPHEDGELRAVIAEAAESGPLSAVLLNAGALRQIGPNRMWVETARRWAARGVPTLRVDLAGIGDSDGDAGPLEQDEGLYIPRYVAQTLEVLEALARHGLPARFVLAGLCSGAYWALHAALCDERVVAAYMVNPRAIFWDWRIARVRDARELRKVARAGTWQKLLRGEIRTARVRDILSGALVAVRMIPRRSLNSLQGARLEHSLDHLQESETDLVWVFTAEEPLRYELARSGQLAQMIGRENVHVEDIPGPVTSHTLEPLPLQRRVGEILDAALERQLRRARDSAPVSGARAPTAAQSGHEQAAASAAGTPGLLKTTGQHPTRD